MRNKNKLTYYKHYIDEELPDYFWDYLDNVKSKKHFNKADVSRVSQKERDNINNERPVHLNVLNGTYEG